jgi:hypothetical protein
VFNIYELDWPNPSTELGIEFPRPDMDPAILSIEVSNRDVGIISLASSNVVNVNPARVLN